MSEDADNEDNDEPEDQVIVEPEHIHEAKMRVYVAEKEQLINMGWKVTMKTSDQGINVGSKVMTKASSNSHQGAVVGRSDDDKRWIVLFDDMDGVLEEKAPQSLKLVDRNDNFYEWKLVAESNPPDGIIEDYDEIGIIGFDFDQFAKPSVSKQNTNYQTPYLKLLMHLK